MKDLGAYKETPVSCSKSLFFFKHLSKSLNLIYHIGRVDYKVKPNSFLAFIAKKLMKANGIAMVLGNTIHLNGVNKEEFLRDSKWLRHELVHIRQFKTYGFWRFIFLYLLESIKHGYYNNKFEIEARSEAVLEGTKCNIRQ